MPCQGCGCSGFSSKEKTDKCSCACHSSCGTDCFWRTRTKASHNKSWSRQNNACNCECHHDKNCKWMCGSMSPPYSVCTCGRLEKVKESKKTESNFGKGVEE